jgi:copper chaperone CopZ
MAALHIFDLQAQCAGFNKVLGPFRQHLRAATAAWLVYSWGVVLSQRRPKRQLFVGTMMCIFLTFLPEILSWSGGWQVGLISDRRSLAIQVDGMGCEACLHHVRQVLAEAGAVQTTLELDTGAGSVEVEGGGVFDFSLAAEKLEKAGFFLSARSESPGAKIETGGGSEL